MGVTKGDTKSKKAEREKEDKFDKIKERKFVSTILNLKFTLKLKLKNGHLSALSHAHTQTHKEKKITHTLVSHNTSYGINNCIFVKLSRKLFAVLDNAGVYMVIASGGWIRMKQ